LLFLETMQTGPRLTYFQILKYVHAIIEFKGYHICEHDPHSTWILGDRTNDNSVMAYSALDLFYYSPNRSCSSAISTKNTLHLFNIEIL
jgi:hypothetical protein